MYNNVKFTKLSDKISIESYKDLGLLLSPFELEIPETQTNYIDIPGRDGSVDLTEVLGQINYNNRDLDLNFTSPNGIKSTVDIYGEVANFLHGQCIKITLPSYEDYYLIGRCGIGNLDRAKKTGQITITANCEPYKYKQAITEVTKTIGALPYEVIIDNLRMLTVPTITTTDNVIMNFENTDYSWSEGEHLNTSIILKEGKTHRHAFRIGMHWYFGNAAGEGRGNGTGAYRYSDGQYDGWARELDSQEVTLNSSTVTDVRSARAGEKWSLGDTEENWQLQPYITCYFWKRTG